MTERKNPIHNNEGFTCEKCQTVNEKAPTSCRNHCIKCFYSKHVDDQTPGDRKSKCQGLMMPMQVLSHPKKGHQIVHQCLKCGETKNNKLAKDDSLDVLIALMLSQNFGLFL